MKILVGSFQCESNTFSAAKAEKHPDADGIYLFLHGAMCVEGLGSGAEFTVKKLRKTGGDKIPISLGQDFHGTLVDGQIFCMTPGTATNDFSTLPFRDLVGEYCYVKPE